LVRTVSASLLLALAWTCATPLAVVALPAAAERAAPREKLVEVSDPTVAGMDAAALRRVDAVIEAAIAAQVTPGAALAIGRFGQPVRLRGYGRTDYRTGAPRVNAHTIYDLASLTKPVATTTAAMLLVQDGLLDIDAPLAIYLPEWRGRDDRARMTVRHLLNHTSGLPAGGPLRGVVSRAQVPGYLATIQLQAPPGVRPVYSDYGMILLAAVIERISGEPMDALLQRRVFEPMGLEDTGFNPLRWQASSPLRFASTAPANIALLPRIAPTERTPSRGLIHGEVHDGLALRLGGVAGHAGLFGSAHDLAVYAQMLLAGGGSNGVEIVKPDLLRTFVLPSRSDTRFALGWELAREANSSAGAFAATAFGHTGFTGTSIWVDPERQLYVVLLTNRLNPNSREQRHVRLRRDVHTAVAAALRG
jgi:CubicO group peptidase (beta-lactamase class C family)